MRPGAPVAKTNLYDSIVKNNCLYIYNYYRYYFYRVIVVILLSTRVRSRAMMSSTSAQVVYYTFLIDVLVLQDFWSCLLHGFAINDRASWLGGVVDPRSAGAREGATEREREREDNTPASTKSNSKRYKIVAAAVTDTRR